jgi:hypothetical protein
MPDHWPVEDQSPIALTPPIEGLGLLWVEIHFELDDFIGFAASDVYFEFWAGVALTHKEIAWGMLSAIIDFGPISGQTRLYSGDNFLLPLLDGGFLITGLDSPYASAGYVRVPAGIAVDVNGAIVCAGQDGAGIIGDPLVTALVIIA